MNLKLISLFLLLFSLLIACKNDKQEVKKIIDNTPKKEDTIINSDESSTIASNKIQDSIVTINPVDSTKTDLQLGIIIDSLEEKNSYATYKAEDYKIEDYVLNTHSTLVSVEPDDKYFKIPYIIKHNEGVFFDYENYPEELIVRTINNDLDTIDIITSKSDCYNCLEITKIQNKKEKELYYKITTNNDEVIATKGNLDSILVKRNLTIEDVTNTNFITRTIDDWKERTSLSEKLNKEYTFSHNLNLKKKSGISTIKNEIDKLNLKFNSLDSLKYFYKKYINANDAVSITNLIEDDGDYKYFHSGAISYGMEENIMMLVESIDITYISKNNDLFKVRWLENYSEITGSGPLDDNYVVFKNGIYGINDWKNKRMISLFHPDMKEDDYLVIYELKLKYLDTYIHSPVKIINYEVPNSN